MEIIQYVDEIIFKHGYYTIVVSSHEHRTLVESITTFVKTGWYLEKEFRN